MEYALLGVGAALIGYEYSSQDQPILPCQTPFSYNPEGQASDLFDVETSDDGGEEVVPVEEHVASPVHVPQAAHRRDGAVVLGVVDEVPGEDRLHRGEELRVGSPRGEPGGVPGGVPESTGPLRVGEFYLQRREWAQAFAVALVATFTALITR